MNVTELARQLRTTREELLAKLPGLGFAVGGRAIKIDNLVAEKIKQAWAASLRKERLVTRLATRQEQPLGETSGGDKALALPERITVNDLAAKLGLGVAHLIGYLLKNGVTASLNDWLDFETASLVAEEFGFKASRANAQASAKESEEREEFKAMKQDIAADEAAAPRPPVVVVMGHVDHGKTTLLDAIRQTNVVAGEAGGITQHIGAYQIEEKGRMITFLDTPGHEAFAAMRERGGQVADVAILVVAADDGLQPQTLESINVIQREALPFVVAINKIDKPGADIDKVKKDLAEVNLASEDWGGKTVCVPVSAKQKLHIAELLDTVLLVADMEKFSANPNRVASGVIIESHIDTGEGPVATVLVNAGTLRLGDEVVIGAVFGRVKALKDWRGRSVAEAGPSTPVKILGLKGAPAVGDILRVATAERKFKKQYKKQHGFTAAKSEDVSEGESAAAEAALREGRGENAAAKINIILKADVLGSLEAILSSIKKLERRGVAPTVIRQGLGNINENDIALAENTGAILYGFNVQLSSEARRLSFSTKARIRTFKIIYELLDDLKGEIEGLVKPQIVEIPQGELSVLKVFKDSRTESIVGGRVAKAKIQSPAKFRLWRAGELLDEGKVVEIQQNRRPVTEAAEGVECGLKVSGVRGIKEGDVLACFREEEVINRQ